MHASQILADAIVLDVMLPDIDGFEVCRRLRRSGMHTPVLRQALRGRRSAFSFEDQLRRAAWARQLLTDRQHLQGALTISETGSGNRFQNSLDARRQDQPCPT